MSYVHDVSVANDSKDSECAACPACRNEISKQLYSFSRPRYWIASFVIQSLIFILGFLLLRAFINPPPCFPLNSKHPEQLRKSQAHSEESDRLVGTYLSPINAKIPYKTESTTTDYWKNGLYFGEPTYASDYAWNKLTTPRLFRLHPDEALRLNFEDSVRVEPGEDYGTILGIIHNLHCLRHIRQTLYPDYYYPEALQEELDYNRAHSLHCLEAIRSSLLCYPDLNPHPYLWSDDPDHNITVSGKVTRQCVDWQALGMILEVRNFDSSYLMNDTGPSH